MAGSDAAAGANTAGPTEAELARVRSCATPGEEGGLLDMWTQTPATALPSCRNRSAACPAGSTRAATSAGDQCIIPDMYAVQLKLRFRFPVVCAPGIAACHSYTWLQGAAAPGAPLVLAAAAIKLAQCFQVAQQEVLGAVMVWTGSVLLERFQHQRTDELWRRLHGQGLPPQDGSASQQTASSMDRSSYGIPQIGEWSDDGRRWPLLASRGRRLNAPTVNVEFAWRVDSYRLSPSSPTALLNNLLNGNGRDLVECLGIPGSVNSIDWTTERNSPDLATESPVFGTSFSFVGLELNELPTSVLTSAWPASTVPPSPVPAVPADWAALSTSSSQPPRWAPSPSQNPWTPRPTTSAAIRQEPPGASSATPAPTVAVNTWSSRSEVPGASDGGVGLVVLYVAVAALALLTLAMCAFAVARTHGWRAHSQAPQAPLGGHAAHGAGRHTSAEAPSRARQAWEPPTAAGPPPHAGRGGQGAPRSTARATGARDTGTAGAPPRIWPESLVQEPFCAAKAALAAELRESLAHEALEERRRRFRELCLQWHPDKNGNSEESTAVFQFLQAQKAKYLDGPGS